MLTVQSVSQTSSRGSSKMEQGTLDLKRGDSVVGEMQKPFIPVIPMEIPHQMQKNFWRVDSRYKDLLQPLPTWEQKVVKVLHRIRCRELTEYDPKHYRCVPTRFCHFNIAFFDLDKESEVVHGPLFREIPHSKYIRLDDSINLISMKVAQSDIGYPINIYGTVLARDQNDYRCVYLFKRGREDPQLITRKNRSLALTGPYRALSGAGGMFFEFNLKIKGEGPVDEIFSKGLLERNACRDTPGQLGSLSLKSYLSKVDMVYMPLQSAVEASIGVKFLNGKSNFFGKIFASASGNNTSKMVLYDSKVAGTDTKLGSSGSVSLSRHIVAVPLYEDLVLYFYVREGINKSKRLKFVLRHGVEERTCKIGTSMLQLKIIWKGVFRQQCRWKDIGHIKVLW